MFVLLLLMIAWFFSHLSRERLLAPPFSPFFPHKSILVRRGGLHGYDGGKKVSGRKRHLLVDTMDLLLNVVVHAANLQDRESVNLLLEPIKGQFPRMEKVWVDQGYTGKGKTWIETQMDWTVEVVERSPRRGWIMTEEQELVWVTPRVAQRDGKSR